MSTAPRNLNSVDLSNPYAVVERTKKSRSKLRSRPGEGEKQASPWIWILALCCVVALGISGYLAYTSLTSSKIAGCGAGNVFDCSHVTNSKWSLWMGIPVSMLAIGAYVSLSIALTLAVFQTSPVGKRFAWMGVTAFALSAGLAAVWFTGLQVLVLKHLCSYCLIAHACGIVASVIAVWKIPDSKSILKFAAPFAMTGMAVLIVGQIYQAEPEKFRIETFEPAPAVIDTFDAPFAAPTQDSNEDAGGDVFEAPVVSLENRKAINMVAGLFSVKNVMALVRPASVMMAFASPLQNGNTAVAQTTTQASKSESAKSESAKPGSAKPESKKRRTVGINGGTIKLNVDQWPLSGPVDAKHVFVEMLDYNCPNCRKTHKAVSGAKQILNNDVSVVILPIPLNTACNSAVTKTDAQFIESCDIAKLAIAVWRVDPVKFRQFHDAMFANEQAPNLAEAKQLANSMVDAAKLEAELASGIPGKFISSMVKLYEKSGKGGVPKLMFPGTSIVGEFSSAESLADVIRQQTK